MSDTRPATAVTLRTPLGRSVKIIEQGAGQAVVFLHSGVGTAAEFKAVFSLWPSGERLIAIDAYRGDTALVLARNRTLDDYADQVYAVAEHVGGPLCLVGFSWGGATTLRVAVETPDVVRALALIEPEAYMLLRRENPEAYAMICGLRDRWRAHVAAGRWEEAVAQFIDFYNGAGAFARWPEARRAAFVAAQQERGDPWDVLFDDSRLTVDNLRGLTGPVHLIEGSQTSPVDHAICDVIKRHVPDVRHTVIDGAGHMMPLTHPEPLTEDLLDGMLRSARAAGGRRRP